METVKVRIQTKSNVSSENKLILLKVCNENSIRITKVTVHQNEYAVFCLNYSEAEKMFRHDVLLKFERKNFTPILPNDLRTNRSVIVERVDPDILKNECPSIKAELESCNDWCGTVEIVKLPNSSKLKVIFSSSAIVERACKQGLFMYYLHIPHYNISKDIFVKMNTCFSCYAVEDHFSSNCPKKIQNPLFKICSQCSLTDHDFRSCQALPPDLKCINCNGNHSSMAMSCPTRKHALRNKRNTQNKSSSFSQVTKTNLPPIHGEKSDLIKSISLIVLALFKNVENPGCFANKLNALYEANNMTTLNLGHYSPPTIFF